MANTTTAPKKYIFNERGEYVLNPEWQKWKAEQENKTTDDKVTLDFSADLKDRFNVDINKQVDTTTPEKISSQEQAYQNIMNNPNLTEEEKKLKIGKYDIAMAKASGGTSLSIARSQEVEQQQQFVRNLLAKAKAGQLTAQDLQEISGANINWNEVLGAGTTAVIPGVAGGIATGVGASIVGGALAGAGTGAVAGGTAGALAGPAGVITLGALGALSGFLIGTFSNIRAQQSGEYSADKETLRAAKTTLAGYITLVNQDPSQAPMAIEGFYATLQEVDRAHAKTWKDSQENVNIWLGKDGTPELAKFKEFDNQLRPMYEMKFLAALQRPNSQESLLNAQDWEYIMSTMGAEE